MALYGKKRDGCRRRVGMAISYGGVLLVFGHEVTLGRWPCGRWARPLVLGSAISYALYLSLQRRTGANASARYGWWVWPPVWPACCALRSLSLLRPLDTAFAVAPVVLWLSLLNATACTVVPVLMVMMAIERIGARALPRRWAWWAPCPPLLMGVLLLDEPMNGVGGGRAPFWCYWVYMW